MQTFQTPAVRNAGATEVVLGVVILAVAAAVGIGEPPRIGLPGGLAGTVVALLPLVSGIARMRARLEVHATKVVWTWVFSRTEVSLAELTDAALVEPGAPVPGGAVGAIMGGGIFAGGVLAMVAWWLLGFAGSMTRAQWTLGNHALYVMYRYGPPRRISAIGTWASDPTGTDADHARRAILDAIEAFHRDFGGHNPGLEHLDGPAR